MNRYKLVYTKENELMKALDVSRELLEKLSGYDDRVVRLALSATLGSVLAHQSSGSNEEVLRNFLDENRPLLISCLQYARDSY